jgi:hypothetical protein
MHKSVKICKKIDFLYRRTFQNKTKKMKQEIVFFDNIVDDVTYYIGTNAKDNFDVIDMGKPNDYWFHASNCSSCHVVVQLPDDIDKRGLRTIVKRGARLCKENTHITDKVEIIYTRIKNVTKTDVVGCVNLKSSKSIIV